MYCLVEKETYGKVLGDDIKILQCSKDKEELDEIKKKLEKHFEDRSFEVIEL